VNPYVLVVEDEDALATLLDYNLVKEGFRADRAADGEEALLKISEEPPDLIVLDWMLPKVSGVEVCRQLRAGPETRRIPVLMLTARGEESDKVRGLDTGADDYLVKPFAMSELVASRVRGSGVGSRPASRDPQWTGRSSRADRVSSARLPHAEARPGVQP
jgi:two-component system phosphate regulon response regulator PhoB